MFKQRKKETDLLEQYISDLERGVPSKVLSWVKQSKSFLKLLTTARFFALLNKKLEPREQFVKSLRLEIEKQARLQESKVNKKSFWSIFQGSPVLKVGYALGVIIFAVFIAVAAMTFTDFGGNDLVVLKKDTNQAPEKIANANLGSQPATNAINQDQKKQEAEQKPTQDSKDQEQLDDQKQQDWQEEADQPTEQSGQGGEEIDDISRLASNLVRLNSLADELDTDSLFIVMSSAVNNFSESGLLGREPELASFADDLISIDF